MKKIVGGVVCVVLIGLAVSFIGSNSVAAKPAESEKGAGCYVPASDGVSPYVFDATCDAHAVVKYDDDGGLEFYFYEDHGQTAWHPKTAVRDTYSQCLNFGPQLGIVCGTVKESVTPSGEYKSSFKVQ